MIKSGGDGAGIREFDNDERHYGSGGRVLCAVDAITNPHLHHIPAGDLLSSTNRDPPAPRSNTHGYNGNGTTHTDAKLLRGWGEAEDPEHQMV